MIQFQNEHFTVFESQLYKTTSTVIQTDDCIIVVDPNLLPNEVEEIRQYVNSIQASRPLYLIFTHSDWDHIVGYNAFPKATVIASERFTKRHDQQLILESIRKFDDDYYLDRNFPIQYPEVDIQIKKDGQTVQIGETTLTFYLTEGHTDDGLFTIIEPLGIWLAGDYLSDIEFPFIYHNSKKYEETLRKVDTILENHNIQFLVPGHGHVTNSKEEMRLRKQNSLHYIEQLRTAILSNQPTDLLIEAYRYKRTMIACHEENIQLIRRELNLPKSESKSSN